MPHTSSVLLLLGAAPGAAAGHPAFLRHLLASLHGQRAGRDTLRDHRAGGDEGIVSDGDGRHDAAVAAHERAVADRRLVLVGAVVVDDDHAGTDVDTVADGGVADVGQVAGLGPTPDARLLDLHEVADAGRRAHVRLRAQVTEGADLRLGFHHSLGEHAVWLEVDAVAQAAAAHVAPSAHDALGADDRGALEH